MAISLFTLATLHSDPQYANQFGIFKERIKGGVGAEAAEYINGTPTSGKLDWAKRVLVSPEAEANLLIPYLLGTHVDTANSVNDIWAVTDPQIRNQISNAVDKLYPEI